ncbi:hypothetical protein HAX54_007239 [Datura stramonium]|uniref:Uncharacterized protein n=1 Tax=Datura stramonium TaxID=4076 RepID=A0ABS8WUK6_DATST|nr:hypothetical protein [Datura stramonium]
MKSQAKVPPRPRFKNLPILLLRNVINLMVFLEIYFLILVTYQKYLQRAYELSIKHDLQVSRLCYDPVHLAVFIGLNYVNVSKLASMSTRTTVGDTMRSLPKIETSSLMDNFGEFGIDQMKIIEFHFEPYEKTPHTKINVLGPSSGRLDNTNNHLFSLRSDIEVESVNSEYKKFTRTENGPVDEEEADEEGVANSVEPLRNSCRVSRSISQNTSHSVWDKVNHSDKAIPRASKVSESFLNVVALKKPSSSLLNNTREDGSLHSFANRSFLAKKLKKQIIERWKLISACQEIEVGCRSHILGEMRAMAELETRPQYMDFKHDKHCFMRIRRSGSCSPLCISGKDGTKYEHSRISPLDSRVASGTPKNRIGNEASKYFWHLRKKQSVHGKDSKPYNLKQKAGLECRDLSSVLDQSTGSFSLA